MTDRIDIMRMRYEFLSIVNAKKYYFGNIWEDNSIINIDERFAKVESKH